MTLPGNPIYPAYRIGARAAQIGYRCHLCAGVHYHGVGDESASQWRGSHCVNAKAGEKNVRLIVVGTVAGPHMVPRCSLEDLERLNEALAPCNDFL